MHCLPLRMSAKLGNHRSTANPRAWLLWLWLWPRSRVALTQMYGNAAQIFLTSLLLNDSVGRQLNWQSLWHDFPAEFRPVAWKPPALSEIKRCLSEQLYSNSSRLIKNIPQVFSPSYKTIKTHYSVVPGTAIPVLHHSIPVVSSG